MTLINFLSSFLPIRLLLINSYYDNASSGSSRPVYQTLTILNTQISHGVKEPTEDRLLFRIAVHDVNFEDTGVYKKLS